jgi:hypothetical protein
MRVNAHRRGRVDGLRGSGGFGYESPADRGMPIVIGMSPNMSSKAAQAKP